MSWVDLMLYQFDKANLSDINTYVLCVLVEQKRSGNTTIGTMTKRGYQAIQPGYEARAGLRHDMKQLRNRWNQLKGMYSWFKWATNQTGIG